MFSVNYSFSIFSFFPFLNFVGLTKHWLFLFFTSCVFNFHVMSILLLVVVQSLSFVQLCNPMNYSTPGFPVLHYLLEFSQTHVHWVGDAIQPSHPLSPLLLPSIFPSIKIFSSESGLRITWPKNWSFSFSPSSEYSGLISFRLDWFDLFAVQGFLKSLIQQPQFEGINSLALSLLCGPALNIYTWLLGKIW